MLRAELASCESAAQFDAQEGSQAARGSTDVSPPPGLRKMFSDCWPRDVGQHDKTEVIPDEQYDEALPPDAGHSTEDMMDWVEQLARDAENLRSELEEARNGAAAASSDGPVPAASSDAPAETKTIKITRKEQEKVSVPNFPNIMNMQKWRSELLSSVVAASGDSEVQAWITWLSKAFALRPDLDALNDSEGDRYASIDIKLGNAAKAMIKKARDKAMDLRLEIDAREYKHASSDPVKLIKGREIVAMLRESFRTRNRTDILYTISELANLRFQDDNHLSLFKTQWFQVLESIRPEDRPSKESLRDMLFMQIKKSKRMALDISHFENLLLDDPNYTYDWLLGIMDKHIRKAREEKNRVDQQQGLKNLLNSKSGDSDAAPAKAAPAKKNEDGDAAPVVPKGKGKGKKGKKGKSNDRSQSADSNKDKGKQGVCYYFAVNGKCNKGDSCPARHVDTRNSKGKGKGKGKSKSRSPSPAKKADKACYYWLVNGKCPQGNKCTFSHDPNVTPSAVAKAKAAVERAAAAEAKAKAKAAAAPKGKPKAAAAPATVIGCLESDDSDCCSECSTAPESDAVVKNVSFSVDVVEPRVTKRKAKEKGAKLDEEAYGSDHEVRKREYDKLHARGLADITHRHVVEDPVAKCRVHIAEGLDAQIELDSEKNGTQVWHENVVGSDSQLEGDTFVAASGRKEPKSRSLKLLMDTGCGHDLLAHQHVIDHELPMLPGGDEVKFLTANGIANAMAKTKLPLEGFPEGADAFVLESTPSVLSVGKRCMELGYTFVWPAGEKPFMYDRDDNMIEFSVKGNIPYYNPKPKRRSRPPAQRRCRDLREVVNNKRLPKSFFAVAGEDEPEERDREGDDEADAAPDAAHDDDNNDDVLLFDDDGDAIAPPRSAKVGTLKHEAKTKAHLLTHRYRNPYCQSCVRAKMKHLYIHRGAFKRDVSKWGDLVTFDFIDTGPMRSHGFSSDREILIVKDVATAVIGAYVTTDRSQESVIDAMTKFVGDYKVKMAYSDRASEFISAMKAMEIPLDKSVPGRPQNNSLAERTNQFVIGVVSTCLLNAGLPAVYWPFAISCVSHLLNIEVVNGESAWFRMMDEHWKDQEIPFGALVFFKASDTRKDPSYSDKFDPNATPGIFAGYELGHGTKWSKKYKVWDLVEFTSVSLSFDTPSIPRKLQKPYITQVVKPQLPFVFPLKDVYERANSTIEGRRDAQRELHNQGGDGGGDDDDDAPGDDPDRGKSSAQNLDLLKYVEKYLEASVPEDRDAKEKGDAGEEPELDGFLADPSSGLPDGGGVFSEKSDQDGDVSDYEPPSPPGEENDGDEGQGQPRCGASGASDPDSDAESAGGPAPSSSKPDTVGGYPHCSEGEPGDGKMYINDDGEWCKLGKDGKAYRVGPDGRRYFASSSRPRDRFTTEEWQKLSHDERRKVAKEEKKKEKKEKAARKRA